MNTDQQARHLRSIVTPARTGQEIGRNRRRHHPDRNAIVAMVCLVGFAAAAGLLAAALM